MNTELRPSLEMWNYMKSDITPLQIVSAIADRCGGYHISYSANELLKDLYLYTPSGRPNKRARQLVAWYLHDKYHGSICQLKVISPVDKKGE